jgi:P-type Mg2+ transporter
VTAQLTAGRTGDSPLQLGDCAALPATEVLAALGVSRSGLTTLDATSRRATFGLNAIATHRARFWPVLWRQVRSPLLGLLAAAAVASAFVGERNDAVIIAVIVALSVGLGFGNEFRAEKAAEALHSQIRHRAHARRDGRSVDVDVSDLVPGDIVSLRLGDIVPADLRLLDVTGLECDESVLTGESLPAAKAVDPVPADSALAELTDCALMGTVVHSGAAHGVVVATGASTAFGAIAAGLSTHVLDTEFQRGLRRFSMLLVYVAGTLTSGIFVINVVLHRPVIDALLFSLAIAVGITPQLLPAVVATSLSAGARLLSRRNVLVKRLVCIEDLGDVDVLFTDKTGTLTDGRLSFMRAVPVPGTTADELLRRGLLACDVVVDGEHVVAGNALDEALYASPTAAPLRAANVGATRVAMLPFDHERRLLSVLVRDADGTRQIVTKGAPEAVLARCSAVPADATRALAAEFRAGNRVVAVARRAARERDELRVADECDLTLVGFLVFLDPPKHGAAEALQRLSGLGIAVKIVTGDSGQVAATVCGELGLGEPTVLTGNEVDGLDDAALAAAIRTTRVFSRVSPEQKARIVRVQRQQGGGVAFLGDGVNDALALHAADVGISVDSATDVAKDAADVILLEKDLGVLADGVAGGRRIFANTIKYVLMGTSSNFGNMFSAAGASLFLSFLPMLPSQILLNNLLYDAGQLAIPTDTVDEEQLRRPSHWDIGFIRRFMLTFGPISSIFDFATFAVMLEVFHAGPVLFRSGWFVESLATQTLVIFAIRTRRVPFVRSRPGLALTLAAIGTVVVGAVLPATPLAGQLGFQAVPLRFFAALAAMVVCYLGLIELGKLWFYRQPAPADRPLVRPIHRHRRRRAAYFTVTQRKPGPD